MSHKHLDFEMIYSSPAEEFVLSVISGNKGIAYRSSVKRSIETILCTDEKALITDIDNNIAIHYQIFIIHSKTYWIMTDFSLIQGVAKNGSLKL